MTYSPAAIANYFLSKASQEGRTLTPMQLIKLVYIAHGWHLGYFDRPLISERVQAWKFGPVIDSLYHCLKQYGNGAITSFIPIPLQSSTMISDANSIALLDHVWRSYSSYNGMQLSTMTHQPNTPWSRVWEASGRFNRSEEIPEEEIKAHYKQKIADAARVN